jgi:uncharacterized protein involved in response to NO
MTGRQPATSQAEQPAPVPPVLFALGFRPFFLLVGIAGVALVPLLAIALAAGTAPGDGLALTRWHGHEMLFGFIAAAIAGFLLTTTPTWTGQRPCTGAALAGLAGLWLAGRFALAPGSGIPLPWAAAIDLAFVPALGLAVSAPILRARDWRNLGFAFILGALCVLNLGFHGTVLGWFALPFDPLLVTVDLIAILITLVAGRIVPAFTRNRLAAEGVQAPVGAPLWLDRLVMAAMLAVLIGDLLLAARPAAGWLAACAGMVQLARLWHWQTARVLRVPLLWALHLGYAWLVVGLLLKGIWLLSGLSVAAHWLHAFTSGCFGLMILAVMTRASLGHTGRPLVAPPVMVAAYLLLAAAALVRVFGPALSGPYLGVVALAGLLWSGAFTLFVVVYFPILTRPRVDGRPG